VQDLNSHKGWKFLKYVCICQYVVTGKRVTLQGVGGYASSYYHIPSSLDIVQRAGSHDQEQVRNKQLL